MPYNTRKNHILLSIMDVASVLKLSDETVRQHFRTGRLPGFQIGAKWYMRGGDLEKLAAKSIQMTRARQKLQKKVS